MAPFASGNAQPLAPPATYSSRVRLLKSSTNASPTAPVTQRHSQPTSSPSRRRWTAAEDKVFAHSIARWGTQWDAIKCDLKKANLPARDADALRQRYHILQRMADRQREIASQAASSSSSAQHSQQGSQNAAAALISASKLLHTAPGTAKFWTQDEKRTLAACWRSLPEGSTVAEVHKAFCRALPLTTRSEKSIGERLRLSSLRNTEGRKSKNGDELGEEEEGRGQSIGSEADECGGDQSEGDSEGDDEQELTGKRAGRSEAGRSRKARTSQSTSTGKQLPRTTAAVPSRAAAPQGIHQARPQSFSTNTSTPNPASLLNVTIERMPDGFKILGLPPGYGVLITSPLDCQAVSPTWWDEHEQEAAASPFAFKRLPDGSIEGVSYPLGTRANMSLVRASQGEGEVRANVGSDAFVQTAFVSADHFRVLFVDKGS